YNNHMKKYLKKHHASVAFIMLSSILVVVFVSTQFAQSVSTSIGVDIATRNMTAIGNVALGLTSSDQITLNGAVVLPADKKVTIDAPTTDQTQTSGALDINVDGAAASTSGLDINMTAQGDYGVYGTNVGITSGADLTDYNTQMGNRTVITGRNSASSAGLYYGNFVTNAGSTANASDYNGYGVYFTTENGGADLLGTSVGVGYLASIKKTTAGGGITGMFLDLDATANVSSFRGIEMSLDVSGISGTAYGVRIRENGASGTLSDAIMIEATNVITDGIDASSAGIVNALNLGANNIVGNGSMSFDLNSSSDTVLTLTNGNGGAEASLSIDGSLILQSTSTNMASSSTVASGGASYLRLGGSGGAVTLSGTTAIADGAAVGQILIIEGISDANTITVNDSANTNLGAATRVLGNNDVLNLIWNGTDWIEISFINN
ncbi:MAG: hypothetical protein AAB588_03500, partial [Patescibacteria group bacterium]